MGRVITVEVSDMQGRIVERLAEVYGCSCGHVRRYSPWGLGLRPEVVGWPCKGCCDASGSVVTWQERISLLYLVGWDPQSGSTKGSVCLALSVAHHKPVVAGPFSGGL